jgi:epoxyqueuosine reductase
MKETICRMAREYGFTESRILSPFHIPRNLPPEESNRFSPSNREGAFSLLVAALPYGNEGNNENAEETQSAARIAPFAQRNYYKEAVVRLKKIARTARRLYGGLASDYRIFCNSPIPEKPLAVACGLGFLGRNDLVITHSAGSLVIIAAITLPFALENDQPCEEECPRCDACTRACPTNAIRESGGINRKKCIQWYASGNEDFVPPEIAKKWGKTLYGCTMCQDVCPYNRKPIQGAETDLGKLPASLNARALLAMTDAEIRAFFKGTAMGLSWLGTQAIKRNARLALAFSL